MKRSRLSLARTILKDLGKKNYLSPVTHGKPDPVVEFCEKLRFSKYFKSVVKEFYKKQSVVLGPTSRFKNSKGLKKSSLRKKEGILLVLSGIYKIDKRIKPTKTIEKLNKEPILIKLKK